MMTSVRARCEVGTSERESQSECEKAKRRSEFESVRASVPVYEWWQSVRAGVWSTGQVCEYKNKKTKV